MSESGRAMPQSLLTSGERQVLLRLARLAIGERLYADARLERALDEAELTASMRLRRGVFVTLKSPPAPDAARDVPVLRGCIGTLEPAQPLYRALIDIAPKAAFEDPRFPPLTRDELQQVVLSISVLTVPTRVNDWREIEVGRDGVQLIRDPHRSVFLPQVADEQGWDRDRLLAQLALKAGLDAGGWRSAELYVFQAESFREDQFPRGG